MILDDLVEATSARLKKHQKRLSLKDLQLQVKQMPKSSKEDFLNLLNESGLHIISEIKKSSPSKGEIVEDFPYLKIAKEYEEAGADAISVLTEPDYFNGHLKYLKQVSQEVSVPVLRKDFTIDPYMVYEAKANGASIILLIVGILTDEQLVEYRQLAEALGMQAIVEAYTAQEVIRGVQSGAKIIGINNRDLRNFKVDFDNSLKLKKLVPANIPVISESGIKTQDDVDILRNAGFNAILVGETLMRSHEKEKLIASFKEG